jgi:PAS domain S-box-containing protein
MLHQEKEKLNALIENLEEGILVSNISHTVLMINSSAKTLLGIEKSVIGASLFEVIPDKSYIQDIHHIILKKVRFISKEITITHPDRQSSHLHLRSSLSVDSKGYIIGIITLLRDITKEKELENLKSGFMRTISHELKTPLTTIIGFTETLSGERRGTLNEDQKNFVKIILDEGIHLSRLINDLLEFTLITANKISLQFEEISLKSLVGEILESFRPQAALKSIELIFESTTNLPSIQADREKIHRAFLNVIHNAIHFTTEGNVTITFLTEKNKIITRIADTGIGIDAKNIDKIFERFIQLDSDGKAGLRAGLGLGLSIARDLIALHDGRIWAESKAGEGSTFYIELPISR